MKDTLHESGMSLIEILVAVAILGVISAALSSTITSMLMAQKSIEARQNVSTLINDVQTLTSNGSTCMSLFGAGLVTFDYNLSRSTGSPVQIRLNNESLSANTTSTSYDLQISRLVLTNGTLAGLDALGRNVYKAQLVGEFKPPAGLVKMGGLSDFKPRSLSIGFFTVNGSNQIVSCSDKSPLDQTGTTELCQTLGGTYDPTSKKCGSLVATMDICNATGQTYNPTTGKCNPFVATGGGTVGGLRWTFFNDGTSPGITYCLSLYPTQSDCNIGSMCVEKDKICAYGAGFSTCRHKCM